MSRKQRLSASAARRIALAAQGFANERPSSAANVGHVKRAIDRLGLLQIDSVNVLTRAHYLPLFSRLGDYDSDHLDDIAWGRRSRRGLFEFWAHEASLLPARAHSRHEGVDGRRQVGGVGDRGQVDLDQPVARLRPRALQHQLGRALVARLRHLELLLEDGRRALACQLVERAVGGRTAAWRAARTASVIFFELRHDISHLINGRKMAEAVARERETFVMGQSLGASARIAQDGQHRG